MGKFVKRSILIVLLLALGINFPLYAKRIVVGTVADFVQDNCDSKTEYIVRNKIDLGGATIVLCDKSTLVFKNSGYLCNGTIVGSNSRIYQGPCPNIFGNCIIRGTWNIDCAYSDMFDNNLDTLELFTNLSFLSHNIKLSADREYYLTANNNYINAETIEGIGENKPTIRFHTIDPNVNGLIIVGNNVVLRNLDIVDDYDKNNDRVFGHNDELNGSTIGIEPIGKLVHSLTIEGCDFSGGTSSSYVASSKVINCEVNNCSFSDYIGDHAIYCSVNIENYLIKKCKVSNVFHTNSLFKVRSSEQLKSVRICDIDAHNLNGYMAMLCLMNTPDLDISFDNIVVTKDTDSDIRFYGFCIYDETKSLKHHCVNGRLLTIHNCEFTYGKEGKPIFYQGAGNYAYIKQIEYDNLRVEGLNFGGCISDFPISLQIFYSTENQRGFKKRGDSPTTIPQQFQLL